jgi:hypothetical protein
MKIESLAPLEQFSRDVQHGVIAASQDVAALCGTHNEERRLEAEAYFPFQFDQQAAKAAVALVKPLKPGLVTQFYVWRSCGWFRKSDNSPRYASEAF